MEKRTLNELIEHLFVNVQKMEMDPTDKTFIMDNLIAIGQNADIAMPPVQPNIKQAAKLLSDFIESCSGGDSYLIAPDGEELRTDWGYATEGIQLILDWADMRGEEDESNRTS